MISLLLLVSFASFCTANNNKFEVEYEWTFINHTWRSPLQYDAAIKDRKYVPENVAPAGIKYHKNKIYIAIPRIREGVPVTLGYIPEDGEKVNPLIVPYPSWEMNLLDGSCDTLHSVQSMEVDRNGTMWVLDGFRIMNRTECPPKLLLLDLNDGGKTLETFNFPDDVCLTKGGFLNDIVVDDSDGGFVYITDNSGIDPGLIVFSRKQNKAWKIRHDSMLPEMSASVFDVDGHKFTALAPIDGIALSPVNESGSRVVYYNSLAGLNLYSISTDILKSENGSVDNITVNHIGKKQAQGDGMMMDNVGNLYYGLIPLYGVGKWNINTPFSEAETIDENNKTLIWTDSFAFDDKGYLYLLANNIHKFFDASYKLKVTDKVMFRILKLNTSTESYLYSM